MASLADQSLVPHPAPAGARRRALINKALAGAWKNGRLSKPKLEPGILVATAREISQLDDFGAEMGWRIRLEQLCRALHDTASLNPLGITLAYGQIISALLHRLRANALWMRYPQILSLRIPPPILIIGQMRSGSTRMQRLLACDPAFAHTRFFESWNPIPAKPHSFPDERILKSWIALQVAHFLNPEFKAIHPASACLADEEIGFHNYSFYGSALEAQWRIPAFARHCENAGNEDVYREFKQLLQTILWLRGSAPEKSWVLKVPQFSQDLGALLSVFPRAKVIILDRDPADVVGSSASLVYNQMLLQSGAADRAWIGREWLRKSLLRQRIMDGFRQQAGSSCIVIDYRTMQDDWRTGMKAVYGFFGLPLTDKVQRRMTDFIGRSSRLALHRHRYDLTDYGLTATQIREAFA